MLYFVTIALIALVIALIFQYARRKYSYFHIRNIPYRIPKFPLGNMSELSASESSLAAWFKDFYFEYRDKHPFAGFFLGLEPVVMATDLNVIKSVLVSNFSSFTDHSFYLNERDDPLSSVLFSMSGEKWRNMRTKLSPTFSNYNTKMMFREVYSVGENMIRFLDTNSVQMNAPFNAKDLTMRFICDTIGSCGFGLNCGALTEANDPPLLTLSEKLFPVNRFRMSYWLLTAVYGNLARFLRLKVIPTFVSEYFRKVIDDAVRFREDNNVIRNDFMNLLIQIKNKGCLTDDESGEFLGNISFDELQAQAFMIFFVGFHTSRVALTFALFELAGNMNIQQRLREEIQSKLNREGMLTYEALTGEMPYLDQVVNETMRKFPPQAVLSRTATADCRLPGTNYVVPKGIHVHIPVIGIHNDPEIYPDPDRFDPDRMTPEKIRSRHPCSFMPFGIGPRNCIGQRFGLLQVKLGIAMVLTKYRLTINSRTRQPLNFLPNRIDLDVHEGIWINAATL